MKMRLGAVGATFALGAMAMAYGPAVTGYTGGSPFGIYYANSTGDVVGFRFTADVSAMVTHLGVLDIGGTTNTSSHRVGLWRNSDEALLASADVTTSSTLNGDFRYEAITSVQIDAGTAYTLGAMYTFDDGDSYLSSPSSIGLDGISGTNGVFPSAGSLGFVFPSNDSTNLARLGPNMITAPVPEPASMVALGLGVAALLRRRRR